MSPLRLRRLSIALLAAGLGASLVVFFAAGPAPENPLGYDPLDSKKYLHDLQVYGGTANVLAAEFQEWFAGLWQGRNLAYTIAVLTVLLVLALRFFYAPIPLHAVEDEEVEASPPAAPK